MKSETGYKTEIRLTADEINATLLVQYLYDHYGNDLNTIYVEDRMIYVNAKTYGAMSYIGAFIDGYIMRSMLEIFDRKVG